MPVDYREKEQEFLGSLKTDTGRDLDEWMRAITSANLSQRNDVIDWLRRQGFRFSRASWLERVHNNGGRPIYADQPAVRSRPPRPRHQKQAGEPARPTIAAEPTFAPNVAAPSTADLTDLEPLLARAKAFRPLALMLIREALKTMPGVRFIPAGDHLVIEERRAFGTLSISPRELRLGLALGNRPFDQLLKPAKPAVPVRPGGPEITHALVLTDARQIDQTLLRLLKEAAAGSTSA